MSEEDERLGDGPSKRVESEHGPTIDARARWLDEGIHEIDLWCVHIGRRVREQIVLQATGQSGFIDESEILFSIFVVVNRLAQIWMRKSDHIDERLLISWLSKQANWPLSIAEAFWGCIRNPTMHLGRPMLLADHKRRLPDGRALFADYNGHWDFEPSRFAIEKKASLHETAEIQRYRRSGVGWESELGRNIHAPNFTFPPDAVVVRFFMPGLLLTIDRIRAKGIRRLKSSTYNELLELSAVMAVTGVFLTPGYSPPDRLDALNLPTP